MAISQLPEGDQVFLDHIGHFIKDIPAATETLKRCGFLPTPFSVQTAPTGADGAMEPTDTGNVCPMLPTITVAFILRLSLSWTVCASFLP